MRTIIGIHFWADTLAIAEEKLRTSDCGADVATANDVPVLKQASAHVTLERGDPRVLLLLAQLKRDNIEWTEWHEDRFAEEELEGARLLMMQPDTASARSMAALHGERPSIGRKVVRPVRRAASRLRPCSSGARTFPSSKVTVRPRRTSGTSWWTKDSFAALEDASVTGLSFRSVYGVMKDKRQVGPIVETVTPPPAVKKCDALRVFGAGPVRDSHRHGDDAEKGSEEAGSRLST